MRARLVLRVAMPVAAAAAAVLCFCGCQTLEVVSQGAALAGSATGVLTEDQAKSVARAGTAVAKTFSDITPEQEYYIGRTVSAMILKQYKPYDNQAVTMYLNQLGQALAQASDRPETFGGYRFLALDSDEVNAFAAPGGLIFVTRGLLRCCADEDAVAAVLAHEVSHAVNKDGLRQIKQGRLTSALTVLAAESAKSLGGQELAELTASFEESISDITSTLVNNGYSRDLEYQADRGATTILRRVGYDPYALDDMLAEMRKHLKPGGHDFAKTHPAPDDRIARINKVLGARQPRQTSEPRQQRFQKAMAGI